ncbi:alpha/beta hydrolase [Microbacterium sp. NPDC064584]|uniref:alpha/beta fold hydrolase n=1 Tax=Microbacterium sp. NPDC064584 TaxID=3155817 RepID=UPI00341C4437
MPTISTSSGPVEYQQAGTGMPVLILHGTPGGADQGLAVARVLDIDARVVAPSRPGYLGTPLATGRTPAEQGDAMVALMDALDLDSAVVLGVSGGGMTALAMAARHPTRVRGVVLWSAVTARMGVPVWPLVHGPLSRRPAGEAILRRLRRTPRLLVGRAAGDRAAVEAALAIAETVFPIDERREGVVNDARQARRLDAVNVSGMTAPALIVHGTRDRNVPFRQATHAARALPHARIVTVPGATHWTTPADRAARSALKLFLSEISNGPERHP